MANSHYDLRKMEKKLKKYLDHHRMVHTRGVMYTAACLGMAHDCDLEQCQTAGLLHDCAKCIPDSKKLRLCAKNHIDMTDYEMRHPLSFMQNWAPGLPDENTMYRIPKS